MWVFPKGWRSAKGKSLCFYLVLADDTDEWPEDWKVTAAFSLSVICQHDPGMSHKKEVNHEFNAKADGHDDPAGKFPNEQVNYCDAP